MTGGGTEYGDAMSTDGERQQQAGRAKTRARQPWGLLRAFSRADTQRRKIARKLGLPTEDLAERLATIASPEERSRELMRFYAEADTALLIALGHGTDLATLETLRGGSRLVAELAQRRLAVLGLKSGEAIDLEPSQKMQEFLERWYAGRPDELAGTRRSMGLGGEEAPARSQDAAEGPTGGRQPMGGTIGGE